MARTSRSLMRRSRRTCSTFWSTGWRPGSKPLASGRTYTVAGRSCLAGDVFGTYTFPNQLRVGDLIPFSDAADYTMVKKNWFNGVSLSSIVVRHLDGTVALVKTCVYDDLPRHRVVIEASTLRIRTMTNSIDPADHPSVRQALGPGACQHHGEGIELRVGVDIENLRLVAQHPPVESRVVSAVASSRFPCPPTASTRARQSGRSSGAGTASGSPASRATRAHYSTALCAAGRACR